MVLPTIGQFNNFVGNPVFWLTIQPPKMLVLLKVELRPSHFKKAGDIPTRVLFVLPPLPPPKSKLNVLCVTAIIAAVCKTTKIPKKLL